MTPRGQEPNLTWRAMVRLPPELGEQVERMASRELMATSTVLRRLASR
jgi:hypothetical protein